MKDVGEALLGSHAGPTEPVGADGSPMQLTVLIILPELLMMVTVCSKGIVASFRRGAGFLSAESRWRGGL